MLKVSHRGVEMPNKKQVKLLRKQFSKDGYLHLEDLLTESLANDMVSHFNKDNYYKTRLMEDLDCVEHCASERINEINRLLSDIRVLNTVGKIYAGPPLTFFEGNVVRRIPDKNHFSSWHTDDSSKEYDMQGSRYRRALALSLNISENPYEGGALAFADIPADLELNEETFLEYGKSIKLQNEFRVHNRAPGTAVIFDISSHRCHRVEDVISGGPRTVMVGWFYTEC